MRAGERVRLRVESLAFGGDAVARAPDGRVVFVAGGVPGDEVDARIDQLKRDFARATVEEVVAPGAARVAARCPLTARCGGCQWQEASLPAQHQAKQAIAERALGRIFPSLDPLRTPAPSFGYRSRARFTAGPDGALGYAERRSHRIVDVAACPLLAPALDGALQEARRALGAPGLAPGGTLAGIAGPGGAVQLAVIGAGAEAMPALRGLLGRAGIVGLILDGERVGAAAIDLAEPGESKHLGAADGFAQAGPDGNRALRAAVAELIDLEAPPGRVLELHAGDGNFTRDLAARAAELIAVEGDRRAVERLRINLPGPSVTALGEPVEQVAARFAAAGERFDLVVMDPPRTGARELAALLSHLAPRLVYVSCDPMTLARDARLIAAHGLAPRRAIPLDLMPHTSHLEVVTLFDAR